MTGVCVEHLSNSFHHRHLHLKAGHHRPLVPAHCPAVALVQVGLPLSEQLKLVTGPLQEALRVFEFSQGSQAVHFVKADGVAPGGVLGRSHFDFSVLADWKYKN